MVNPLQVRILILDHNNSSRELLAQRFSIFGFNIVLASSCDEAWRKINEDPQIKILIVDFSVSVQDCQELIKKCKSSQADQLRVFAIESSALISPEIIYSLGAEGILHQPFDARNLLNITRNSLLGLAERLRYPPYFTPAAHLEMQFSSVKEAAPHFLLGRGGFYVNSTIALPAPGQAISFHIELGTFSLAGNGFVRWQNSETIAGVELSYLKAKSIQGLQLWLKQNPTTEFIPSPQSVSSMPSKAKLQSTG